MCLHYQINYMNMYSIETIKNSILHGDILENIKQIPSQSIDLIVTSPPYNLRNTTGGSKYNDDSGKWKNGIVKKGYNEYQDDMPHDEYVKWQRECLSEMMRVLKDDGAIFYNHKWRVQNGLMQDRHDIIDGFPLRQIIIWQRSGGMNFNKSYFLPTYEVIYMIAKKKFILADKANRHGDIWKITQEKKSKHPAPFPLELADRIISSTNAKLVLDPFMGSGTTAIACKKLNREYIGIELSDEYIKMANERIENCANSII